MERDVCAYSLVADGDDRRAARHRAQHNANSTRPIEIDHRADLHAIADGENHFGRTGRRSA